jgi:hypothetical protein
VATLDGCTGAKAGRITRDYHDRPANSLNRVEAADLLRQCQQASKPVRPERLGAIGPLDPPYRGYGRARGTIIIDSSATAVPAVVEVWMSARATAMGSGAGTAAVNLAGLCINRSPVVASAPHARYDKSTRTLDIFGCGLSYGFAVGRTVPASVLINVQCPAVPRTNDGKQPDLWPFCELLTKAIADAARVAYMGHAGGRSQKAMIWEALPAAVEVMSEGGRYTYLLRQLFYVMRPTLLQELKREPDYGTFSRYVAEYEAGDRQRAIPPRPLHGLERDPRGSIYHPHVHQRIPLGTRTVRHYRRPEWTLNKVLYIEKEGFFDLLIANRWPDENDCMLLTSKGQASGACKDLLDGLADDAEPITVFCLHDADAAGTSIYEALVEATRARPARRIEVINLGLEPWQAEEMELPTEAVTHDDEQHVGQYVYDYDRDHGTNWAGWLQRHRVELNAIIPASRFLSWLTQQIAAHGPDATAKVVPPDTVRRRRYRQALTETLEERIRERILRENKFREQVAAELRQRRPAIRATGDTLESVITEHLAEHPADLWSVAVEALAREHAIDAEDDARPSANERRRD